jgi:Histidine kinase-like ATPase domain
MQKTSNTGRATSGNDQGDPPVMTPAARPCPAGLPARTRSASHAPAPAPARTPLEVPKPRPDPDAHGSRYASAPLDPHPTASREARALIRDHLAQWGMSELTEAAELIAAELTSNALKVVPPGTTGLSIILAIHATTPGLLISLWDIGPGEPCLKHPDPDDPTGRGLFLIDYLTAGHWGTLPTPESKGKVVWAELTRTPAPAARDAAA